MQNAKRSLLSFLLSVVIHAAIVFLLFWSHLSKTDISANSATGEISTSISMEMIMAMVEAEPPPVEEKAPEPEKQEVVEDPTVKPEPPKVEKSKEPEKPKEKPKQKPKEKPKVKPNPDVPIGDRTVESNSSVNSKATTTGPATTTNPNLVGNGASNGSELDAYRSALRREIEKHKRYPARAKMMRKQGIVTVSFSIGADGSISGASIAKSSGAEDLDNAALSAVNSARSIGPRPAGMGASISVPISFKIN
jgi:tonB family C-terminal domain